MVSFFPNNDTSLTSFTRATCPKPNLSRLPCPLHMLSPSFPVILLLILLPITALLVPFNICPSLVPIYPLLSTKSLNSCTVLRPYTCKPSNASYDTLNPLFPMAYSFAAPPPTPFTPTQMLTGPAVLITENPLVVSVSFLAPISSPGPPANNGQLPALALNPNIALLLPLPLNSFGSNPYSATLAFTYPLPPPFGVTTLGPPISLPTLPSMLVPNILKLTFTSFVTRSPPKP
jgi:hypothetical protein